MNKSVPFVTVLMSVYNDAEYLDEAIRSIVDQTYSNFEFLVIDDGSKDESKDIIKKWANKDSRIRPVFFEENKGLGHALSRGVRLSKGKWIARMDADDISMPHRLEEQVNFLERNSTVDILSSWAIEIDAKGNELRMREVPETHEEIVDLLWAIPIIHPAVIFRRKKILEAGSYSKDIRRRQDYELWFRCASEGVKFANIQEPLIYYRFTENFFKKNDLGVAIEQTKIGFKGCWKTNASLKAYIGVTVPLVRALMPQKLNNYFQKIINKFDPRKQSG